MREIDPTPSHSVYAGGSRVGSAALKINSCIILNVHRLGAFGFSHADGSTASIPITHLHMKEIVIRRRSVSPVLASHFFDSPNTAGHDPHRWFRIFGETFY